MEWGETAPSPAREASPTVPPTPIMPWQTPWGTNNNNNTPQQEVQDHQNQPTPSDREQDRRVNQPTPGNREQGCPTSLPAPSSRPGFFHDSASADMLVRERERERGQRRMRQQHYQRQTSLDLLEVRSTNRALEQQQQQARGEIAELRREQAQLRDANDALRNDLQEERAALERVREEDAARLAELTEQVVELSEALAKQVSLLAREKKRRRGVQKELEGSRAALAEAGCAGVDNIQADVKVAADSFRSPSSSSSAAVTDKYNTSTTSSGGSGGGGSTDGSQSSSYGGSGRSPPSSRAHALKSPPAAAFPPGSESKDGRGRPPLLPKVLEEAKLSLTNTMSRWLKGMHSACSPEVRRALVLPWLLHKLFYLSTELIDAKRDELRSSCVTQVVEGASFDESAFVDHLRSNYLSAFPLGGDSQKTATHDVMMALACSMVDSEGWNKSVKDPIAVGATLAASGLEKIVKEYLRLAVLCCLQQPVVTFTDDLGEVERYHPERHSEPLDGEPPGEWSIVVFPAFVVAVAGGDRTEERVVGKRLILNDVKS
ncbi:unnamed protein product [Pylaiella littoralis]